MHNNLWAAVGGLAIGRVSMRRSDVRAASAYQAGQQSATARQDPNTYYQAAPPAPAASSAPASTTQATPLQQLELLQQMLDKDLITQNEYNRKKQEILAAM